MIRDELELITGRLITGPITPVVFQLLKDGPCFDQVNKDLDLLKERGKLDANLHSDLGPTSEVFGDGFDVLRWVAEQGQSVTLPGDGEGTVSEPLDYEEPD